MPHICTDSSRVLVSARIFFLSPFRLEMCSLPILPREKGIESSRNQEYLPKPFLSFLRLRYTRYSYWGSISVPFSLVFVAFGQLLVEAASAGKRPFPNTLTLTATRCESKCFVDRRSIIHMELLSRRALVLSRSAFLSASEARYTSHLFATYSQKIPLSIALIGPHYQPKCPSFSR